MGIAGFKKRLHALEQILFAGAEGCSCRAGQKTFYHDSTELARILSVSCPAHGFRDLGEVMEVGSCLVLRGDDQQFCSCRPSALREFLLGRRGSLSPAEQLEEEKRWMQEYEPSSDHEFREDQGRVTELLKIYRLRKSIRRY